MGPLIVRPLAIQAQLEGELIRDLPLWRVQVERLTCPEVTLRS